MKRKQYEEALRALKVELCALQDWVKAKGLRVIVRYNAQDDRGVDPQAQHQLGRT